MSKVFRDHFERHFRISKKNGHDSLLATLASQKSNQPIEVFGDLVKAFKKAVPNTEKLYRQRGREKFRDLWWFGITSTTTIEKEFLFAVEWLRDGVEKINEFRNLAHHVEDCLLRGEFSEALNCVHKHRSEFGWTVWGVELEYAVTSFAMDATDARNHTNKISEFASPRIAMLLAAMFRDRNDESISLNAFIDRCRQSIPRLGLSRPLQGYLHFRAYNFVENIREDGPNILACELNNSIIDYYEALIDLCTTIATEEIYDDLRPLVEQTSRNLLDLGVSDHRLVKIRILVGAEPIEENQARISDSVELLLDTMLNRKRNPIAPQGSKFLLELISTIEIVHGRGTAATTEINNLFKLGLNIRGVNIGPALTGLTSTVGNNFATGGVCAPWGQFATSKIRIEDFLALATIYASPLLNQLNRDCTSSVKLEAERVLGYLNNDPASAKDSLPGYQLIWVIRERMRSQAPGIDILFNQLISLGNPWNRHALKLKILNAISNEDLEEATYLATRIFLAEPENMSEVPLQKIFEKRKWADFKLFDPVIVGIVSHNAFLMTRNANSRYICRMACRSFKGSGARSAITNSWEELSPKKRLELLAFLESIWVDDNLTMAGFLSTQEVRIERIEVLQLLLQINPVKEIEYAEEIKELTFSETLWKGLQHINETRIFVNEAAISRWAEKELLGDFQRWKTMFESDQIVIPELDEILRHYLVGSDSTALLAAFQKDDLTQADALLLSISERLLNKFLMDPADGLNCYLSSRIRHGTLKGALLGPLEEAGILGASDADIANDYRVVNGDISAEHIPYVVSAIQSFGNKVSGIADRLVKETVQIRDVDTPKGYIYAAINPEYGATALAAVAADSNFTNFLSTCFDIFWGMLRESLSALANHFRFEVRSELQMEFDDLIISLKSIGDASTGLTTVIRTVATATQSQCDLVANWFESDPSLDKQVFSLGEAIEIAKTATKYIYRSFPVGIVKNILPDENIPLTPLGLSAITDGLYVMLVNAWKHSGLGDDISWLSVSAVLDMENNILVLTSNNPLSTSRLEELRNGGLQEIREKYILNPSLDMVPREGGSGFAKLAGLIRMTDKSKYPDPLSIELSDDDAVTVKVCIPVYQRGDAFDAYFE